jgi:MFS family permease
MRLEDITLALFAACNFVRLFAYLPQIYKAATDKNGASAISYTTWGLFLIAHLSTIAYALANRSDWWLAACFACNAVCCLAILAVAYRRRLSHARSLYTPAISLPDQGQSLLEYAKQSTSVRLGSANQVVHNCSKEVKMPLFRPEELSSQDRVTYRRWVGGMFVTYGTILLMFVAFIFYQTMIVPTQRQVSGEIANAKSIDHVRSAPVRQAVKYD